MSKKINIDAVRFIVTFLIVAIHISPFAQMNGGFDFFFTRILGRIAVPLFLMITGYYVLNRSLKNKEVLKDYSKKILKIYLFCILIYIPINIYMGELKGIHVVSILKDIFMNGTFYHLWYFPALVLGLWITYYLLDKMKDKKTLFIVIVLYFIGLLGDSYYGFIRGNEILVTIYDGLFKIFDYTRNGVFFVPIFLYLGYHVGKGNRNICSPFWIFFLFLLMTVEGMTLHHYDFQRHDSMYIFLIPLMYFFFSYIMAHSEGNHKPLRNIATGIYIFHPFFLVGFRFLFGLIGLKEVLVNNNLLLYVIVSITTFIFVFMIQRVEEHYYERSRKTLQGKSLG